MREPTRKQLEVLRAIQRLTKESDYPPTVREVQAEAGLASPSTVKYHLLHLKEKGLISYEPKKARTIKVLFSE